MSPLKKSVLSIFRLVVMCNYANTFNSWIQATGEKQMYSNKCTERGIAGTAGRDGLDILIFALYNKDNLHIWQNLM